MSRRLNISLPDETVRLLDRVAAKGERSQVIAEAVTRYVVEVGRTRLRKRMKERALARAALDVRIAEEWFPVDEEAWDGKHDVAAMTSQIAQARYPTEVVLHPPEGGLAKPSAVLLNQIRSVDRRRLVGRLGRLKPETMARVDRAFRISLGLVKV